MGGIVRLHQFLGEIRGIGHTHSFTSKAHNAITVFVLTNLVLIGKLLIKKNNKKIHLFCKQKKECTTAAPTNLENKLNGDVVFVVR